MIGSLTKRNLIAPGFAGLLAILLAAPAYAVVPEIKVDPETGVAEPIPELTLALAAIEAETKTVQLAENFWQRAPWHRT